MSRFHTHRRPPPGPYLTEACIAAIPTDKGYEVLQRALWDWMDTNIAGTPLKQMVLEGLRGYALAVDALFQPEKWKHLLWRSSPEQIKQRHITCHSMLQNMGLAEDLEVIDYLYATACERQMFKAEHFNLSGDVVPSNSGQL